MNWYKKTQQLEIVDQTVRHVPYTDIGHDIYNEEQGVFTTNQEPNYMWVLIGGMIDVEEETGDIPGHGHVNRWDGHHWEQLYVGRYSSEDKIITIRPPRTGIAQFREIPYSIRSKLNQAFPDAEQLYVYSLASKKIKTGVLMNWYKKTIESEKKHSIMQNL